MTPIERIARTLRALSLRNGGDCRGDHETGWRDYTEDARIVLQAIREPSEAMLGACDSIGLEELAEDPRRGAAFWHAMIDAALKEG